MENGKDYTPQWKESSALTRLQKAIPQILKGKGLYDKYK